MGVTCPRCQAENPSDSKYCKECATPLAYAAPAGAPPTQTLETPREELTTGTTFAGRYQIVEELGGGGMGKVYRALDIKVGEEVALKLIKPEIAADKTAIERFKNELKIARKIVHKSIGRVYDLNEDKGTYYFTMEYIRGEDLKAFIRSSGQLAVGTSLRIARQVAEGLAEAHDLGVVHRDLKPSNIMIDLHGNARIMDFGIARLTGAKGLTGGSAMIGTPEYMSPEQVEGKDAGFASDIYSLGIVLFEMLTGRVPFEGETALSIAVKQKSEAPPDPRTLNPQIPEDLDRLILKCLEKSKDKRYQTAAEFLAALAAVEKSLPTTRTAAVRKSATSKEITVRLPSRKIWIPAAAVLIALLAFAVWQFIPERKADRRTIAVIGFKNQSGDVDLDYLREAIPHLLITSLGESKRLRVISWERMKDLLRNSGREAAAIFDESAGFEACRKEGIEAIVIGSFVRAGDTYATEVQVLDASTKHLLKSASAKGAGVDSILKSQIDEISRTIRRGIALPPLKVDLPTKKVADLTTGSMEAYNFYLRAQEAYDNFFWVESRSIAEKAVSIDPTFAVAYDLLSRAAEELLDSPARDEALEKARIYSAKATERERLFIEARYAFVIESDDPKRRRLLTQLLDKDPDDKDAHYELGRSFFSAGSYQEALAEYQRCVEIDPKYAPALNMLGYTYAATDDFDRAIQSFRRYAELRPGLPNPIDSIAEMNMLMGNLDEAVKKYKEALAIKPDFYNSCTGLAYVFALQEDYPETGRWLEEFAKRAPTDQAKMEGAYLRVFYDYFLGRREAVIAALLPLRAVAESYKFGYGVAASDFLLGYLYMDMKAFDKARLAFESWADYQKKVFRGRDSAAVALAIRLGAIDLGEGRVEALNGRLAEVETILPKLDPGTRRDVTERYFLLAAEAALARNSVDDAIVLGIKSEPVILSSVHTSVTVPYNIPFLKDILARAYRKKGELDNAIAEYERLTTIDPKSRLRRLIPPLYHYRFGRVLEEKGEKDRARLEYQKFLKYWAEADPVFPELADARARLSALR